MMDTNTDFKTRLNNAFRALRKRGLIAKQNFSCCSSCAGFEIATLVKEMSEAQRSKVVGCCTYNKQSARSVRQGLVYLQFGQVSLYQVGDFGLPTIEVGHIIVDILKTSGLDVEWDGTEEKKILVQMPSS